MLGLESPHSPNADDITHAYWVMVALAALLVIAVNAGLVWALLRFRAKRDSEPARTRSRPRTQYRVGGVLALVAVGLYVAGVVFNEDARDVPDSGGAAADSSPLEIRAVGQQWLWRYEYPESSSGAAATAASTSTQSFAQVFSYYELVVPVDTTVELDVDSTDVVHRWWVPELGAKVDATPGHAGHTWFRADHEGVYDGQSAGYSGASYAVMRTAVRVVSQEQYEAWIAQQGADIKAAQTAVQDELAATGGPPGLPPEEAGQ